MWCLTAPGLVAHSIRDDKGAGTFKSLMGGYRGTIVCDALKTHEAGARDCAGIALAGCWAHVFRKFEEAAPDHPEASLALRWIGHLYAIDERAADLQEKAELRRTDSAAVIATMQTWLWGQATLKTLSIGKAAAYVVANWDRLTRFLQDARIPLDNNATERGIRGPVVGRKNHSGSKSRRGTEIASIFYSLLSPPPVPDTRCGKPVCRLWQAADASAIEVGFSMVLRARLLVGPGIPRAHRIVAKGRKAPEHAD
jgi:transposase